MGESHGYSLCSQRWRKTLSTSSSQGSGQEESPCPQSTSAPEGGKGLLDHCCPANWKAVFLRLPAVTEPGPRRGLPYISLRQPWEGKGWVLVPEVRREPVPWAKLVRGLPTGWNVRWCWWWSHLAIGKKMKRGKMVSAGGKKICYLAWLTGKISRCPVLGDVISKPKNLFVSCSC